uniref:Spermine synthase n=1 Tax=Panagrolaimus sp. PS1159 TaxID=55785 RepID=A0AC35FKC5_9BILA
MFRLKTVIITFIFGFICFSFLATIFGYSSYDSPYPPNTYKSKIINNEQNENHEMLQDVIYSKFQNVYFSVIDFYVGNIRQRYLKHGNEQGQVTWVTLKENGQNGFEVDKNVVKAIYYRFSILAPFIVNKNLKDFSPNMSILLFGLGGGALTNYLANLPNMPNLTTIEIDPTMKEISMKWFNLKESERNKIIIGDGVKFIEKTNQKFDSIILDACTNNFSSQIICPVQSFLNFNVISNLSSKLKPNGVFSANIGLSTLKGYKKALNKILKKYSKVFKLCFILYATANYILVCSNDSTAEIVTSFNERFQNLPIYLQKSLKAQFEVYNPEKL